MVTHVETVLITLTAQKNTLIDATRATGFTRHGTGINIQCHAALIVRGKALIKMLLQTLTHRYSRIRSRSQRALINRIVSLGLLEAANLILQHLSLLGVLKGLQLTNTVNGLLELLRGGPAVERGVALHRVTVAAYRGQILTARGTAASARYDMVQLRGSRRNHRATVQALALLLLNHQMPTNIHTLRVLHTGLTQFVTNTLVLFAVLLLLTQNVLTLCRTHEAGTGMLNRNCLRAAPLTLTIQHEATQNSQHTVHRRLARLLLQLSQGRAPGIVHTEDSLAGLVKTHTVFVHVLAQLREGRRAVSCTASFEGDIRKSFALLFGPTLEQLIQTRFNSSLGGVIRCVGKEHNEQATQLVIIVRFPPFACFGLRLHCLFEGCR